MAVFCHYFVFVLYYETFLHEISGKKKIFFLINYYNPYLFNQTITLPNNIKLTICKQFKLYSVYYGIKP